MDPATFARLLTEQQVKILQAVDEHVREVLVEPFTAAIFADAADAYAAGIILCRRHRFPWQVLTYLYEMEMKCRTLELHRTPAHLTVNWEARVVLARKSSTK